MAVYSFLADSNVKNFWDEALTDRKELQGLVSIVKVVSLGQFDEAMSSVTSGHVVLSLLTNPIVDHISSISPASQDNLETSISSIMNKLFEAIYGLCFRLTDSKVFVFSAVLVSAYCCV
jgi:hypothetical protein